MITTLRNLCLLLLCTTKVCAQNYQTHKNELGSNKTTGLQSRLIAHSTYGNSITPSPAWRLLDSTHYSYAPKRGYDTVVGEWKFTTDTLVGYQGVPTLKVVARDKQTFTANDNIATQLHETTDGAGNWSNASWNQYQWNVNNTISIHTNAVQSSGWDSTRTTYTYNPNNKITLAFKEIRWSGNIWRNSTKVFTTYNINGTVASLLTTIWDGVSKYDTANRFIYNYNGTGRLTQKLYQSYASGNWTTDQDIQYTYDIKGNLIQYEAFDLMNAAAMKFTYAYDINNDLATEERFTKGGIVTSYQNEYRNVYTYNSFHQVVKMDNLSWNPTTSTYDILNNTDYYYYETYATDVNKTVVSTPVVTIYPVPASDELHISLNTNTHTDILIFDMSGKLVKSTNIYAGGNIANIDIRNIESGTYTLQASCDGKVSTQLISIIK